MHVQRNAISRRLAAEAVGSAFLLAAVVGSGIMGERLSGGNMGLALLANALATGAALVALILAFGSISGAHFNPAVTVMEAAHGGIPSTDVPGYVVSQVVGAVVGVVVANIMFGEPTIALSQHARHGGAQLLSEAVATFGLLTAIAGAARHPQPAAVPIAVGAYIAAAYWFTASTSFANPAVTLARSLTDTFTGISPTDVPAFVAAQLVGAGSATVFTRWLLPVRD